MLDNMTAVSYVNKGGGTHSLTCNLVDRDLWLWAKERDIWLFADQILGCENVVSDFKSRNGEHRNGSFLQLFLRRWQLLSFAQSVIYLLLDSTRR